MIVQNTKKAYIYTYPLSVQYSYENPSIWRRVIYERVLTTNPLEDRD